MNSKFKLASALAWASLLTLAACGGGSDSPSATASTAGPSTSTSPPDSGPGGDAGTEHTAAVAAMLHSIHPVGETFQVVLPGHKEALTATLKGDVAFIGDMAIGRVEGDRVVGAGGQVLAELNPGTRTVNRAHPQASSGIVNNPERRWPNGVIPYEFDGNASAATRAAFEAGRQEYLAKTAIRWVPRNGEANYVRIITGDGCWSYVGITGGRQDLSLGNGCSAGPATHEMGHAAGLSHEHQRSDRDQWVRVNLDLVDASWQPSYSVDTSIYGTPIGAYDYESVMHYPNYQRDGRWVFESKTSFPTDRIGPYHNLSNGDLQILSSFYGGAQPVCFYEHVDYQGASFCASSDSAGMPANWNDRVSSVRVPGGTRLTLYVDSNYGGGSITLQGDANNLVAQGFNDLASSFLIRR